MITICIIISIIYMIAEKKEIQKKHDERQRDAQKFVDNLNRNMRIYRDLSSHEEGDK